MKPERIQFRYDPLRGWVLVKERNVETGKEEPTAIWTAFEMTDHLEACELVPELGRLADKACATPQIDVRQNVVFVTATTPRVGLTEEDFDFAEAVDREIGHFQRASSLLFN